MTYVVANRTFTTLDTAKAYAEAIWQRTGVVVAIEQRRK
jgi:hypothetical protein